MSLLAKILGDSSKKQVKKLRPIVTKINRLEESIGSFSDEELRGKTLEFKKTISERLARFDKTEEEDGHDNTGLKARRHKTEQQILWEILPEAFAIVREASKRTLGMRHFDVQMIGGVALHLGKISEMRTGEGKTLVSTLAIYLNALSGFGVHVVTVNDYLAKRDAQWMGKIFDFLGMKVGVIVHEKSYLVSFDKISNDKAQMTNQIPASPAGRQSSNDQKEGEVAGEQQVEIEQEDLIEVSRKEAYAADITYGTNNEFGFDYLRDNMAQSVEAKTQRELHYAVIDEIDSILIDEARTPLIISAPAEESGDLYRKFAHLVPNLSEGVDYTVDEKLRAVSLTDDGIRKMEGMLGMSNIYDKGVEIIHHLEQALKANVLFKKDKDYVVKDGEIIIVDEFTGRMMFGRRYSEGLHQAIEAKEGVEIKNESVTMATITFQNLFRLYAKLSGMTGTAMTESEEFFRIYKLDVVAVPTNRQMIRRDLSDRIFKNETGKFQALVE